MAQIVSPHSEEPLPDNENENEKSDPGPAEAEAGAPDDRPAAEPGKEAAPDEFRLDTIAARVDTLGEESDIERIAREEEKKLHEGKRRKKGLQGAAPKRRARRGGGKVKRPPAIVVSPDADPLLERT